MFTARASENPTANRPMRPAVRWPGRLALIGLIVSVHAAVLAVLQAGGQSPGQHMTAVAAVTLIPDAGQAARDQDTSATAVSRLDLPAPPQPASLSLPALRLAAAQDRALPPAPTRPGPMPRPTDQTQTAALTSTATPTSDQLAAAYAMLLWNRIAAARPPGMQLAGQAVLQFSLDRNGQLLNAAIAQTSGNRLLDKLALRCLRQAAPFPAPPAALPDSALMFRIAFHFN